jgi:hypothetical protein
MDQRDERILAETSRHRITGTLRLPSDGYRSRLTDYVNSAERSFLPLTDVEIVALDGHGEPEKRAFIALSLAQVVLVTPVDASHGEDQSTPSAG